MDKLFATVRCFSQKRRTTSTITQNRISTVYPSVVMKDKNSVSGYYKQLCTVLTPDKPSNSQIMTQPT